MGMNATIGGGGVDLVQEEVNAPGFRQVRAARGRNTLLLCGCNILPRWESFKDTSGYKGILSSRELEAPLL